MNVHRSLLVVCMSAPLLAAAPTAWGQSCKPDVPWSHLHSKEGHLETTNIEGTRATRLEICTAPESAAAVQVEIRFAGSSDGRELKPGQCVDRTSQWAIIRSRLPKGAAAPATASGVYRVCKD